MARDPLRCSQYLGQSPGQRSGAKFPGKALTTTGLGASPCPLTSVSPFIKHDHGLVLWYLMVLGSLWVSFPQFRCFKAAYCPAALSRGKREERKHQPTRNQSPWGTREGVLTLVVAWRLEAKEALSSRTGRKLFIHSFTHLQIFTVHYGLVLVLVVETQ